MLGIRIATWLISNSQWKCRVISWFFIWRVYFQINWLLLKQFDQLFPVLVSSLMARKFPHRFICILSLPSCEFKLPIQILKFLIGIFRMDSEYVFTFSGLNKIYLHNFNLIIGLFVVYRIFNILSKCKRIP